MQSDQWSPTQVYKINGQDQAGWSINGLNYSSTRNNEENTKIIYLVFWKAFSRATRAEKRCPGQRVANVDRLKGKQYSGGPTRARSARIALTASEGWNASQNTWPVLLLHGASIGTHVISALFLPMPQQALSTTSNPVTWYPVNQISKRSPGSRA